MGPDAASSTPADSGAIVSIIVPTLNEAENLPLLVPRIAAAMTDQPYEVIVVDDGSADETAAVCARLAEHHPLTLHVRDRPTDGLSGAVLSGFGVAKGDVLVVMDADLQHPPEALPALIQPLRRDPAEGGVDFVVGSRHAPGGGVEAGWSVTRRACSRVATLLARPFAGRGNTDPMSGFFALRRSTLDRAQRLTPLGFKVGLELMCKCRAGAVKEVPIHFRARTRGRSKLTLGQQFKYLEHLSRLYDFTFPRGSPVVKFVIATGVAWFTGFAAFLALTRFGAIPMPAATLSYAAAIVATGVFHLRYVRTQRQFLVTRAPWRDFLITCLGEWTACAVTATWIANRAREIYPLEVFLITYSVATLARYVLRKELLQDLRGLRKDLRSAELT